VRTVLAYNIADRECQAGLVALDGLSQRISTLLTESMKNQKGQQDEW
jgi:hypothetical protein